MPATKAKARNILNVAQKEYMMRLNTNMTDTSGLYTLPPKCKSRVIVYSSEATIRDLSCLSGHLEAIPIVQGQQCLNDLYTER